MFKKKSADDWNFWDEDEVEIIEELQDTEIKPKRRKKKKKVPESDMSIGESVDYLSAESANIYTKEEGTQYSKVKITIFSVFIIIFSLFGIGYSNTDFDEFSKGYVVNYDLHYERQYVDVSDELYDYCLKLKTELKTVMPEMANNSLSTANAISKMQETLKAKTDKVSRYTEVPQVMASYNDNLITFSLSSQKMLGTILTSYTNSDYMSWAEKAYTDFSDSLQTLEYLRGQINEIIYRNVYGGED